MTINQDRRTGTSMAKRASKGPKKGEQKLNRLLLQLIASAAIFLLVFVGGGLIPEQVFDVFGSVRQVISGDQSLLNSVEALGEAVSAGESWPQAVREWCVDTFLPTEVEKSAAEESAAWLESAAQFHSNLLPNTILSAESDLATVQSGQQ